LELSDGGLLALDWYDTEVTCLTTPKHIKRKNHDLHHHSGQKPIVCVVPGVTGDGTKLYMIELIEAAA
jgi:predicted alpha/beta-fold hydrolase